MHFPGSLVRHVVENVKDKLEELSLKTFRKEKCYPTLLLDANSLYQEASLLLLTDEYANEYAKQTSKAKRVHAILKDFFERILTGTSSNGLNKKFQAEVVFSSTDSFRLKKDRTADLVDSDPNVIGSESALYAWEAISTVIFGDDFSNIQVFISTSDTFTALLQRAAKGTDDLCPRVICSCDPRFRCVKSGNRVVTNIVSAALLESQGIKYMARLVDPSNFISPGSWALLSATDIILKGGNVELSLEARKDLTKKACTLSNFSKGSVDEWISFLVNEQVFNEESDLCSISSSLPLLDEDTKVNRLGLVIYFNYLTEFSRFSGTLAVCRKISRRIMAIKRIHPCQYHHFIPGSRILPFICDMKFSDKSEMESEGGAISTSVIFTLSVHHKLSSTKCFSRCSPIREAFTKFCSRTCSSPHRDLTLFEVLRVTSDDPSFSSDSVSVLNPCILAELEKAPNTDECLYRIALWLLVHTSIVSSSVARLWKDCESFFTSLSSATEENKEEMSSNHEMELLCSMFHVYLAVVVSDYPIRGSFPFLGEYFPED